MAQKMIWLPAWQYAPRLTAVLPDTPARRSHIVTLGDAGAGSGGVLVERYNQPQGEAGVMNSLRAVAKLATEAMYDPLVQRWAIARLARGGNPQNSEGRAKCILEAIRKEKIWVPDPTNTEVIRAARLTLGEDAHAPTFDGGDCDDLATAMLGAFLAACASVDAKAATVGHSYRSDRQLEHVLGSILGDDANWHYVEPSSQVIPFGKAKNATREVVILVPSQELVCDSTSCFRNGKVTESMFDSPTQFVSMRSGPAALDALARPGAGSAPARQDADPRRKYSFGLDQLHRRPDARLGAEPAPPDVAVATAGGWSGYLNAGADDLEGLRARVSDLYDGLVEASEAMGFPRLDENFTAAREKELIELAAMLQFMIQVMREGASGVRRLVKDGQAWGIEGLATDLFRLITAVDESDGSTSVVMVKVKPPEVAQRQLNQQLGLGPVAIAGLVAAGLAAMGVHFLMLKTLAQLADSSLQAVLQYRLQAKYFDCIDSGKCSAQQVIDLQKAFADAQVAMTNARTQQIQAQNKPIEDVASAGKWWLAFAAAVLGILAGYEFKDEIKSAFSGGGSRGGSPRSSRGPATTRRSPAGSRTPGGTMISRY